MPWLENALDEFGANVLRRPWRRGLRRNALHYAGLGWDVTPGAWLAGRRFECGRLDCRINACHPAFDDWERSASHDPTVVARWWRRRPYAVLLNTGRTFDVLEVPSGLGSAAVGDLPAAAVGGPVAVAPGGRWMFLVRPGAELTPPLAGRPDVVLHGRRSWVPAPPTRLPDGPVRWRLDPRAVGFHLADPYRIQSLIVASLPPAADAARTASLSPAADPARAVGSSPVPGTSAEPALPRQGTAPRQRGNVPDRFDLPDRPGQSRGTAQPGQARSARPGPRVA